MARSNQKNKNTKSTPPRKSSRTAPKAGLAKQLTLENSLKNGKNAGNPKAPAYEDSSDDEEYTSPENMNTNDEAEEDSDSNGDANNEVTMLKAIEEVPAESEINDNGKRPEPPPKKLPNSILRKNIRAKHKSSIVINPYTPKVTISNLTETQARRVPVKDCTTTWQSRFTDKLSIPESTNPFEAFHKVLKGLVTCDDKEKMFILPWAEKDRIKIDAIDSPDDISSSMSKLNKFIPRFFPGKGEAMTSYFKLYIGHDRELQDLQMDVKYWLMSGSHGMYFETLQCENAIFVGWLLWSLKSMDATILAEDILQMTGIPIGLRWMTIDTGARGKVDKADKVFALHIEVARRQDKRKAKKAFLDMYGKNNTDAAELPLYLRLRFITPNTKATSGTTITKLKRLRECQKHFLDKIGMVPAPSLVHLDWRKGETTQQTLQELMMELQSTVYENTPIFFSVDLDWTKTNHIISFLPVMKEEAVHTLHALIPLLRYIIENQEPSDDFQPLHIDDLHSFFTDEAVEDTEEMYYDKNLGRIVDPLMDDNLEFVDNENLLGAEDFDGNGLPIDRPQLQQLQTGNFPGNSGDSISTLGRSMATGMLSPGAL